MEFANFDSVTVLNSENLVLDYLSGSIWSDDLDSTLSKQPSGLAHAFRKFVIDKPLRHVPAVDSFKVDFDFDANTNFVELSRLTPRFELLLRIVCCLLAVELLYDFVSQSLLEVNGVQRAAV